MHHDEKKSTRMRLTAAPVSTSVSDMVCLYLFKKRERLGDWSFALVSVLRKVRTSSRVACWWMRGYRGGAGAEAEVDNFPGRQRKFWATEEGDARIWSKVPEHLQFC